MGHEDGKLIPAARATEIILNSATRLDKENIQLENSLGRVLIETIIASRDVPPLKNSAMDGFAITAAVTKGASEKSPVYLPIVRTIHAGDLPGRKVDHDKAVRIMTGAPVPDGVDTVVPVEQTSVKDEILILAEPMPPGKNVREAGEDIAVGGIILEPGRQLKPADIGLLASQGVEEVSVYRRPVVAILATGDEVVPLGQEPTEAQIYSSNSYSLAALVTECGALPRQLGIARDEPEHLAEMIRKGLKSEVLITTGGISMGDHDYLKDVFGRIDVKIHFWRVAQKPGKPMTFGEKDGTPVFALPGNPVSAMLSFELYVRPALRKMMGHSRLFRPTVQAVLEEDIRKKRGRRNFIRGVVRKDDGTLYAKTTGKQGSGILRSMSEANGIIILPEDVSGADAGDMVEVYLLDSEEALA
ncbi:MAG: gephyrin-like molybdotransferase Glp [bacterium]